MKRSIERHLSSKSQRNRRRPSAGRERARRALRHEVLEARQLLDANSLTFVLDFVEDAQGQQVDKLNNAVDSFDATQFGFAAGDETLIANAVLEKVRAGFLDIPDAGDDPLSPLPNGQELDIDIFVGDVGQLPVNGASEYYVLLIGDSAMGVPLTVGTTLQDDVRDGSGNPNNAIAGENIGAVFTDIIDDQLVGITPFDALTTGDLEFTSAAIANYVLHELGQVLTLTDVQSNGAQTLRGLPPIMGVIGPDLNDARPQEFLAAREFSIDALSPEAGDLQVNSLQTLIDNLGTRNTTQLPTSIGSLGGPQLIGINPNAGSLFVNSPDDGSGTPVIPAFNVLDVAPTELKFRFIGDNPLDPATLAEGIQITRSNNGVFGDGDDIEIIPGFLGLDDTGLIVTARMSESLPDDTYRVSIIGFDDPSRNIQGLRSAPTTADPNGLLFEPTLDDNGEIDALDDRIEKVYFELELGGKVTAVVPQPIDVSGPDVNPTTYTLNQNAIDVYFDDTDLFESGTAIGASQFYQLIDTQGTVTTEDDDSFNPASVEVTAADKKVRLSFDGAAAALMENADAPLRLRIGDDLRPRDFDVVQHDVVADPGILSTAAEILPAAAAGNWSVIASETISNFGTGIAPLVDNPGASDEPGHRDIEIERHYLEPDDRDADNAITTIPYTFLFDQVYGTDSGNNPLKTAINAAQESRFREILDLYGSLLGIDFFETEGNPDGTALELIVGDLSTADPTVASGLGGVAGLGGPGRVTMDFLDFQHSATNRFGGSFFDVALHEIGHAIGLGHSYDLPPGTVQGSEGLYPTVNTQTEWAFPGDHDLVHGEHLHQKEALDVDMYRFDISDSGTVEIQTIAERLTDSSLLDTRLTLYRETPSGQLELLSANDDYFGKDSFIKLSVDAGTYYVGVAAEGNTFFDPNTGNTAAGGVSEGDYQLRLDFKSNAVPATTIATALAADETAIEVTDGSLFATDDLLVIGNEVVKVVSVTGNSLVVEREQLDTTAVDHAVGDVVTKITSLTDGSGTALDGDRDGIAGGNYNFWFQPENLTDGAPTLYVRPSGEANPANPGTGDVAEPFKNIRLALAAADTLVQGDNGINHVVVRLLPDTGPDRILETTNDNLAYEVGFVTGVNQPLADGRGLIVPGGVRLVVDPGVIIKQLDSRISIGSDDDGVDRSGSSIQVIGTPNNPVYFTSYRDTAIGRNFNNSVPVAAGDWGGIEIRNDVDREQGRADLERQGIFTNYINHARISYGGGNVTQARRSVDAIQLSEARAEVSYNTILDSANNAISADPDTFEVSEFTAPRFQRSSMDGEGFVSDYDRIGPSIHGNNLFRNSTNGLFVRFQTPAGGSLEELRVTARFDDRDIVHVLGQSLLINGTGGNSLLESAIPSPALSIVTSNPGNLAAGTYSYRYTFVDAFGYESLPSDAQDVVLAADGQVSFGFIPAATQDFVGRRLYRNDPGAPADEFKLVAELDLSSPNYVDNLAEPDPTAATLRETSRRPRLDASLIVDPGTIIKSQGTRIELQFGATLIAEGGEGRTIVFTALGDDRYGAGGTFDTNDNGDSVGSAGDWAGIYASPTSRLSLDHAFLAFGGGVTGVEGGTASFNVVQIHQADARIANSVFENNAAGTGQAQGQGRAGLAPNDNATIYVTAAQPTIVGNTFELNRGAAINANVNSFDAEYRIDVGRQTGEIGEYQVPSGSVGPIILGNRLDGNDINGVLIRGEVLTTEVVWDDTDIVHVLQNDIEIPDLHTFGGMRLQSSASESLVVKLSNDAQILATGRALDIVDRIGGRLQVLGQPGFPVVMTATGDTTVGAGFTPEGLPQFDTFGGGGSLQPGTWQGLTFDPYSHDRNVASFTEREGDTGGFADVNAEIGSHQELGLLAPNEKSGDESLRLGYTVQGAVASEGDRDLYSFRGVSGTMVWLDIDQTDPRLDSVVEILDGNGKVLALSQNSHAEETAGALRFVDASVRPGHAAPMPLDLDGLTNSDGSRRDLYSMNAGDAGLRILLPGTTGSTRTFYVRVRSANALLTDSANVITAANVNQDLEGGLTKGGYRLQVRLQETDEFAGSVVRNADLRYATTAIQAIGLPAHSPLAGEIFHSGAGTIDIGSFSNTDRGAISAAGTIDGTPDRYQFTVNRDSLQGLAPSDNSMSLMFDVDWADGLNRPDTNLYLFNGDTLIAIGTNSNILDDQVTPVVPGQPTTEGDLDRGSHGVRDAFIGPLELNPTGNYSVVVATTGQMLADMAQFTQANPTNPLFRLEPLDSNVRIVDDRFDTGTGANTIEQLPEAQQVAFQDDGSNIVPYQFGDIPLLTVRDQAASSRLNIFNPYTGRHDAIVTNLSPAVGAIAADSTNTALSIARGNQNNANVYSVDPAGVFNNVGGTGITTYQYTNVGGANPHQNVTSNQGLRFESLAYFNSQFLYGLANRGNFTGSEVGRNTANTADVISGPVQSSVTINANNLIYRLNPDDGSVQSRNGDSMPAGFESASPQDPLIQNNGGFNIPREAPWAGTNAIAQVQVPTATLAGNPTGNVTALVTDIDNDRFLFAFTDTGAVWRFNINNGGDLQATAVADLANPSPPGAAPRFRLNDSSLFIDPNVPNEAIVDADGNTLIFDQVTKGPANFSDADNDAIGINDLYFGVHNNPNDFTDVRNGRMYAFTFDDTGGVAHPVFSFGAESVPMDSAADGSNLAGLFFSKNDSSLWHTSTALGNQAGHGMNPLDDRVAVPGGGSLRFANTTQGISGYNWLGGAHGSVASESLDLSGISADDQPKLYFTYLLDTEGQNADDVPNNTNDVMRDSLRVLVAGADGDWQLVATNNMDNAIGTRLWEDSRGSNHEYDPVGSNGYTDIQEQRFVQELFDDGTNFRQARIDLGPWAGQPDVNIRFEFSTAGEARPDQSEIHALPGDRLVDGQWIEVKGLLPDPTSSLQLTPLVAPTDVRTLRYEFDLGLVAQMPAGNQVATSLTLQGPGGPIVTLQRDGVTGGSIVGVLSTDSAADVAAKVVALLGGDAEGSLDRPSVVGFPNQTIEGSYSFSEAEFGSYILSNPGLNDSASVAIPVTFGMTDIDVRDAIQTTLESTIGFMDGDQTLNSAFPVVGQTNAVRLYDIAVTQGVESFTGNVVVSSAAGDTIAGAQDLDGATWSLDSNPAINESTTRPHITVRGTGDGSYDYFKFTVGAAGAIATFDIDNTSVGFNAELHLFDSLGNPIISDDDDFAGLDPSNPGFDSFIQHQFLAPGTYIIGVASTESQAAIGGIEGEVAGPGFEGFVPVGATYTLNVSLDGVPVAESSSQVHPLTLINGEAVGGDGLPGSPFGVYSGGDLVRAGGRSRGLSGGNGVFIDDIVIGLAERGESATSGTQSSATVDNPYFEARYYNDMTDVVGPVQQEITVGAYQLEVRLGREYLGNDNDGKDVRTGVNERLATGLNIRVEHAGGQIVDGDTFELSNGFETLRFEFNDITMGAAASAPDPANIPVNYHINDTAGQIAEAIRAQLNSGSVRAVLGIEATSRGGSLSDPNDDTIVIHGYGAADFLGGTDFGSSHLTGIVTGGDGGNSMNRLGEDNGDRNRHRDQGQFIVDSNMISFSENVGILIDAGLVAPGVKNPAEGDRPKPGAVRNFSVLNSDRLVPGAVVQNNLLVSNGGGIVLSGGGTANGAPSAFSRVANNTIYNSAGDAIRIDDQASPTLLNNVLVENGVGIRGVNEDSGIVIRGTVYDQNNTNVIGVSIGTEQEIDPADPLFVNPDDTNFNPDAGRPNFYPAAGSIVIDNSIEEQNDRDLFKLVKGSVGIPPSPIKVTDRDLLGQQRADDRSIDNTTANNQNVVTDRGAIDRADHTGPIATLVDPRDNDGLGVDRDPNATYVHLVTNTPNVFEIQISDINGIGPDPATILGPTLLPRLRAESTFDVDDEGWRAGVINLNSGHNPFLNFAGAPTYVSNGGNPGGYIRRSEIPTGNAEVFSAPANIVAAMRTAFNGEVGFSRISEVGGTLIPSGNSIAIVGQTNTIYRSGSSIAMTWVDDRHPLFQDGGWTLNAVGGPVATAVEVRNAIETAQRVYVSAEATSNPGDIVGLDSFSITGPDAPVVVNPIAITENGRLLTEGTDYTLGFSTTNGTLLLTPKTGIWRPESIYEITLNNRDRTVLTAPAGSEVRDGDQIQLVDENGIDVTLEYDSGFVAVVPQTLTLRVPGNGGGGVSDSEIFEINDGGIRRVFELSVDLNSNNNRTRILFDPADSPSALRDKIFDAIVGELDGGPMQPVKVGTDQIQIGNSIALGLTTSGNAQSGLTHSGVALGVVDGDTFTVSRDGVDTVFEFDDPSNPDADPNNKSILINITDTNEQIAAKVAVAVRDASIGLENARDLGKGVVQLGGDRGHSLDTSMSALFVTGSPGVTEGFVLTIPTDVVGAPAIADSSQFSISRDGNLPINFEFNDPTVNPSTGTGVQVIELQRPSDADPLVLQPRTVDELAAEIALVISNSTIGFTPTSEPGGVIRLNEPTETVFNPLTSGITFTGITGGAVPIRFSPLEFSPELMALELLRVINGLDLPENANDGPFAGKASVRGGSTLYLSGVTSVTDPRGRLTVSQAGAIRDLAGNLLQANRTNDETQFTILTPGLSLDFGDAPFASLLKDNGARHAVREGGALLGVGIDSETDAEILDQFGAVITTADVDAFDDGIDFSLAFFNPGVAGSQLLVTTTGTGILDGWVDFNRDGDFSDLGERIVSTLPVFAGTTTVDLPQLSATTVFNAGETFARFRLSDSGGITNLGLASGGEVEDYVVDNIPGSPPVTNSGGTFDSYTTAEDTLLVISASAGVLQNDVDPEAATLTVFDPTGNGFPQQINTTGGVVSLARDGSFTFQPTLNFNGVTTFTYRAFDGELPSNGLSTVTLTVTPVNDPPRPMDDSGLPQFTNLEDQKIRIPFSDLLANDGGFPSDEIEDLVITFVEGVSPNVDSSVNVPLTVTIDTTSVDPDTGDLLPPAVIIEPQQHTVGPAKFIYHVTDNGTTDGGDDPRQSTTPATVTLEFLKVNDAPVPDEQAHENLGLTINEDGTVFGTGGQITNEPLEISVASILADDDPAPNRVNERDILELQNQELELLSVETVTENGGTATWTVGSPTIFYTPPQDFFGTDAIFYTVGDRDAEAPFEPPGASTSGDPQSYVPDGNGGFFLVDDPKSTSGRITLSVVPINDPPTIDNPMANALEDKEITFADIQSRFGIQGGPGETQTVTVSATTTASTQGGSFSVGAIVAGQQTLTYTPAQDFFGIDTIPLRLTDPEGVFSDVELTVTVRPVNDAPLDPSAPATTVVNRIEDQLLTAIDLTDFVAAKTTGGIGTDEGLALAGNVSQSLTVSSVRLGPGAPTGAAVNLRSDGTVRLTLPSNYFTELDATTSVQPPLSMIYTVSDGGISFVDTGSGTFESRPDSRSTDFTIDVKVFPVNDAPIGKVHAILGQVIEDTPFTLFVRQDSASGQIGLVPSNGLLAGLPDGSTLPASLDSAGPLEDLGGNTTKEPGEPLTQQLIVLSPNASSNRISTTFGGEVEFVDADNNIANGYERIIYTPPTNFASASAANLDSFSYLIQDDGTSFGLDSAGQPVGTPDSRSAVATVRIQVTPVNDPPQFFINNDVTVDEDTIAFDALDSGHVTIPGFVQSISPGPSDAADEQNQQLTFNITTDNPGLFEQVNIDDPDNGQPRPDISISADGTLQFSLQKHQSGEALVTVTATDNDPANPLTSLPQTFTITVIAKNDAPEFGYPGAPLTPQTIFVAEDSGFFIDPDWASPIRSGPSTALDEDSQGVTFTVATDRPELFTLAPSITSTGALRFTPAPSATGDAILTITATDTGINGNGNVNVSAPVRLIVSIAPANDPPTVVNDSFNASENSTLSVAAPGVLANDSDIDGGEVRVSSFSTKANGILTGISALGAAVSLNPDGGFTYDPTTSSLLDALSTGDTVIDTFTYSILDDTGQAASTPGRVSITVSGVNDTPRISTTEIVAGADRSTTFSISDFATDPDSQIDVNSLQIINPPFNGQLVDNGNGTLTFTPNAGFVGPQTMQFTIADAEGNRSNVATLLIRVTNGPITQSDFARTSRNVPINIAVLSNDQGIASPINPGSVQVSVPPGAGSTQVLADGRIRFTPATDAAGSVQFRYTVDDDQGLRSQPTLVIVTIALSAGQNPSSPQDVNASGQVSPVDALLVINHLNRGAETDVDALVAAGTIDTVNGPFLDVDGNGTVAPLDALRIVNFLNSRSLNTGFGEFGSAAVPDLSNVTIGAAPWMDIASEPEELTAEGAVAAAIAQFAEREPLAMAFEIESIVESISEKPSDTELDSLDNYWSDF